MYLCPTRRPLLIIDSAASGVFNQMPMDADLPCGLSFFFNHAISLISNPFLARLFSSMIFSIPSFFSLSRVKSSVGTWWTMIPNQGFTSLVLFPNSPSHVVSFQAISADWASLNLIMYPVLVVPIPATCVSLVVSVLNSTDWIFVLAMSVGRYLLNPPVSLLSVLGVCWVLILTQLGSFCGCLMDAVRSCWFMVVATSAHVFAVVGVVEMVSSYLWRDWICSCSSTFCVLSPCWLVFISLIIFVWSAITSVRSLISHWSSWVVTQPLLSLGVVVLSISAESSPKLVWFLSHFFLRVDSLGGRFSIPSNVNSFVTPDVFCWGAAPPAGGTTIGLLLAPVQGFKQQCNHMFANSSQFSWSGYRSSNAQSCSLHMVQTNKQTIY